MSYLTPASCALLLLLHLLVLLSRYMGYVLADGISRSSGAPPCEHHRYTFTLGSALCICTWISGMLW
ncbi:hypothetical protein FIBSPDRAFT_233925 [Athelia psychrophila]|uniref:Uncharacterized protein n=1 Tax=Athelia psychrophila TaxID=1759441 RepID=A0A165YFH0_9AGAM|nr:hypothetical protein FIBSPDRAFT_233925 [Fibularhizoctonia sp. CBS 109695]